MAIHTQQSISGFIATEPQLTTGESGETRFYSRFGQEHYRREDDGTFTQTETTYHHLVMFGRSAEHAYGRFQRGDIFVAEGYVHDYSFERDGQNIEGEEFIAKRMGHDTARTRYEVNRAPRAAEQRVAAQGPSKAFESPTPRPSSNAPVLGR